MADIWDAILPVLFIILAPTLIHLAALRGAEFHPVEKPSGKVLNFLAYRAIKWIMLGNGVLLAVAYLLWRTVGGAWWVVPIAFAIPGVLTQMAVLAYAKYADVVQSAERP